MTEITPRDRRYMQEAIDLSIDNIDMGGGPFGAVIVDAEGNRVSTGVNTKADAKAIDFDDSFIYEQLELPPSERAIPSHQLMHAEALKAFEKWDRSTDKTPY